MVFVLCRDMEDKHVQNKKRDPPAISQLLVSVDVVISNTASAAQIYHYSKFITWKTTQRNAYF